MTLTWLLKKTDDLIFLNMLKFSYMHMNFHLYALVNFHCYLNDMFKDLNGAISNLVALIERKLKVVGFSEEVTYRILCYVSTILMSPNYFILEFDLNKKH